VSRFSFDRQVIRFIFIFLVLLNLFAKQRRGMNDELERYDSASAFKDLSGLLHGTCELSIIRLYIATR
jgi:hypothetical protein